MNRPDSGKCWWRIVRNRTLSDIYGNDNAFGYSVVQIKFLYTPWLGGTVAATPASYSLAWSLCAVGQLSYKGGMVHGVNEVKLLV